MRKIKGNIYELWEKVEQSIQRVNEEVICESGNILYVNQSWWWADYMQEIL